jgi:hypothetical protein
LCAIAAGAGRAADTDAGHVTVISEPKWEVFLAACADVMPGQAMSLGDEAGRRWASSNNFHMLAGLRRVLLVTYPRPWIVTTNRVVREVTAESTQFVEPGNQVLFVG